MKRIIRIELDRETDGRRIADIPELPGVMVYGGSREDAITRVQALARQTVSARLKGGE